MKKYLKRKAINFIAGHLFNTITEEDLLHYDSRGRMISRGIVMSKEAEDLLREQSVGLLNSTLWKHLKADLKHNAIQKSLHKSQSIDDVISGKLMLYLIDVIEARLYNISKGPNGSQR